MQQEAPNLRYPNKDINGLFYDFKKTFKQR